MIDSLSFLSLDKVHGSNMIHTSIKQNSPYGADDLLLYFDSYYVNGIPRQVGVNGIKENICVQRTQFIIQPNTTKF